MNITSKPVSDTTIPCTVCGETAATLWRVGIDHLLGGTNRYRAVKCVRCGTRRLDPRPDAQTMAEYYRPETYARAEEPGSEVGKRLDAYAERMAEVAGNIAVELTPPTATEEEVLNNCALDLGCGDGRFMAALQKRGWQITGTETDPVAAELARSRTGATVYETPLPPAAETNFDLISMLHVLEHVPDPRETLEGLKTRMRPGGKLLLVLPNADSFEADFFGSSWYHLDLPRHFWGFTPHSLVRLVETCGFAVDSVTYTPFLFAPQSMLRVFGKVNGAIPGRKVEGTGRAESGGAWQTRVFTKLLGISNEMGKSLPGEIIELTAILPKNGVGQ